MANRNLGMIFRSFTFIDKSMFLNLYKSLVRPHLEYASPIWSPMYKKDRIAIENVQRRATRLVRSLKNQTYEQRLKTLGLPSLEYRRSRADMVQTYKIMQDIDLIDKNKLFTMASCTRTRGHSKKLFKRRARLNVRVNMFSNRVTDTWNSLTEDIVTAPSLNAFKSRLNKFWHGHPCKFTPRCYATSYNMPEVWTPRTNASAEAMGLD